MCTNTRLGILHVNTPFPHKVFCWGCLRHWREAFRLFCWSCLTINYSDTIGTPFVFVSVPCSDWSRCCAVIDCRVVMMPERAIRRIVERSHSLPYRAMPFFLRLLGLVRSDALCILVIFGPFLGARVDEAALLRCCFVASYWCRCSFAALSYFIRLSEAIRRIVCISVALGGDMGHPCFLSSDTLCFRVYSLTHYERSGADAHSLRLSGARLMLTR